MREEPNSVFPVDLNRAIVADHKHTGTFPMRSRISCFHSVAITLAAVLFSSTLLASEPQWVEVRSPNFSVVTDAGEKRGREVAMRFEQMRAVFGALMTNAHVNLPIRLKKTGLPVKVDLLSLLHKVPRAQRFELLGTMNDPDCVAADKPDQYGLMIDRMKQGTMDYKAEEYGWSSGIIGLRLFTNTKFKPKLWSLRRYLDDPGSVEPPYLVGGHQRRARFGLRQPPLRAHDVEAAALTAGLARHAGRLSAQVGEGARVLEAHPR